MGLRPSLPSRVCRRIAAFHMKGNRVIVTCSALAFLRYATCASFCYLCLIIFHPFSVLVIIGREMLIRA